MPTQVQAISKSVPPFNTSPMVHKKDEEESH
jgi:hypothetical protein